jgi:hypothetical protein
MSLLVEQLRRFYYFAEAMAFYEAYYEPVSKRLAPSTPRAKAVVKSLSGAFRNDDRPLTWVPIIWHATTFEAFEQIVEDGYLRPPVSFTELPIGEVDRIRLRTQADHHVAIGFPRAFLETKAITPVLYTKYNPALTEILAKHADVAEALTPYLESNDDTSCFLELRSLDKVEVSAAIWLLTTLNRGPEGRERPYVPGHEIYRDSWGRIPLSLWHRNELLGTLHTSMYTMTRRDSQGKLEEAIAISDRYWREACFKPETYLVRMPSGNPHTLIFETRDEEVAKGFEGPFGFLDVAKRFRGYLREMGPEASALPSALLQSLAAG